MSSFLATGQVQLCTKKKGKSSCSFYAKTQFDFSLFHDF